LGAVSGLVHMRFGFSVISGLPSYSEAKRAATAAERGFAPGVLAPTEILFRGGDFSSRLGELATLQRELERTPGVAGVIGPALPASAQGSSVGIGAVAPSASPQAQGAIQGLIVSKDGSAARVVV